MRSVEAGHHGPAMGLSYVLPLRSDLVRNDLTAYLQDVTRSAEVVVVDSSPPEIFEAHERLWTGPVRHLALPAGRSTPMGKVGNVMAGIEAASHDKVVIADEDVRWEAEQLLRLEELLDDAEVVRPQNWFDPLPWHARWDTGRSLIARALGGDWPGTMGVRRGVLLEAGGYAGDALFENLELARTIEAVGGRHLLARDLLVRRLPPSTAQFLDQRVRQAYDELARPSRLMPALALIPLCVASRGRAAAPVLVGSVLVAEAGRRLDGGPTRFGPTAAIWAPAWVVERAITSWLAVGSRLRGGVRYRDGRLRRAATPRRRLRRAQSARGREPSAMSASLTR